LQELLSQYLHIAFVSMATVPDTDKSAESSYNVCEVFCFRSTALTGNCHGC